MLKKKILIFLFICSTSVSIAQVEISTRRIFNIGTFIGIGGASIVPIPTFDIRYIGTTLRIAPGYKYNGIGITQELFPISRSFYNIYWIISAYYVQGTLEKGANGSTNYTSISVLAGLKYYLGTRFFSELQLGLENRINDTLGFETTNKLSPYFVFGFGVNLFKNYSKKIIKIDTDE